MLTRSWSRSTERSTPPQSAWMSLTLPKAAWFSAALVVMVCLALLYRGGLVSGSYGDDRPAQVHAIHLRLPAILCSHMVLQRAPDRARIWGWCTGDGCASNVAVSFDGTFVPASKRAVNDGRAGEDSWEAFLPPTEGQEPPHMEERRARTDDRTAGGPFDIHVAWHGDTLHLTDVLFGDVFVCVGQSNMEYSVALAGDDSMLDDAVNHRLIRLLTVGATDNAWADAEAADVPHLLQPWTSPSREALGGNATDDFPEFFSAVSWGFALALQSRDPVVPIGLVVAAANGATILTMSPPEALSMCEDLIPPPSEPKECCPWQRSTYWNGMLCPLTPMTFAGMLYYQGESDIIHNSFYKCAFPALIRSWRARSGKVTPLVLAMTHPFPYIPHDIDYLPQMRLNQVGFLAELPLTGIAVTTDLGDNEFPYNSLHPHNKAVLSQRLADAMIALQHGSWLSPSAFVNASRTATSIRLQANAPIVLDTTSVRCPSGLFANDPWDSYCASLVLKVDAGLIVPSSYAVDASALLAIFDEDLSLHGKILLQYCMADWPVPVAFDETGVPLLPTQLLL